MSTSLLQTEPSAISARPAPETPAPRTRSVLPAVLRLLAGIALLGLVLGRVSLEEVAEVWRARTALAMAVCCLVLLAAQFYSAARWKVILGAEAPDRPYLFRLCLVGHFFSLFLPTSVGGDAVRTVAVARALPRPGEAVSGVLLDRLFGVAALAAYLALGLAASPVLLPMAAQVPQGRALALVLAAGALAAVLGVALAGPLRRRLPRLGGFVADAWNLVAALATSPGRLLGAAALALVVQALYVGAWVVLAMGLGFQVPLAFFLFAVPLVSLVAMLPISISGLGLREGAWVLLLQPFAIPAGHAALFGLFYFLAFTVVGALGGLLFATRGVAPPSARAAAGVER